MEKSQSIINVAKGLHLFRAKMGKIKKNATNPFFKSQYADLSTILDEIFEPLQESGLEFTQFPSGNDGLTTILMHVESGEYILSEYNIHPVKNDPQAVGSAISYARRYALCSILSLNVEDDDANAANKNSQPNTPNRNTQNPPVLTKQKELPFLYVAENISKAEVALKEGKTTVAAIEKKYRLTAAMREAFLKLEKKPVQQ